MHNIFKILLATGALSLSTLASAHCNNYPQNCRNYNEGSNCYEYGDCHDCRDNGRMGVDNFHKKRHHREMAPRGFENDFKAMTVKEILNDGQKGEYVHVKGRLTKILSDDTYEFVDKENNSIIAELDDDKDWSFIRKDMPIEVVAKIDRDDGKKILKIKRARPEMKEKKSQNNGHQGFDSQNSNSMNNIENNKSNN